MYIIKVIIFLKYIFHFSVFFLIIASLYPGSLFGYLFYGDWSRQPDLIKNPFGTTINHFIFYLYVSLLGFFLYLTNRNFNKLVYIMFILSIVLEVFHFIVPNRSFQFADLIGNILGVLVAFFLVKIYQHYLNSHEQI